MYSVSGEKVIKRKEQSTVQCRWQPRGEKLYNMWKTRALTRKIKIPKKYYYKTAWFIFNKKVKYLDLPKWPAST
jgi:hypothetical protein